MSEQDTPATPVAAGEPTTMSSTQAKVETGLSPVDPAEYQPQDAITNKVFTLRDEIKVAANGTKALARNLKRGDFACPLDGADVDEMIENSIIAFRHLEDAAMRLGKVMQAKNGGVSILSK